MHDHSQFQTSPTLLGRLRAQPENQTAWNHFVERYGSMIQGWCRRWGLQPSDAEDVTQNVLLQLAKQMSQFQLDPLGSFRAWLKTITYRAWCDFLKDRGKRDDKASGGSTVLQVLGTLEAKDDLIHQMEEQWNRELLQQAMQRVRQRVQEHTWEVFRLMNQEGLSGPEVAKRLNMKVGAVWVAKSKVQKMIYEEVQRLDSIVLGESES